MTEKIYQPDERTVQTARILAMGIFTSDPDFTIQEYDSDRDKWEVNRKIFFRVCNEMFCEDDRDYFTNDKLLRDTLDDLFQQDCLSAEYCGD